MMTKEELINFELRIKEAWELGAINAPVHLCGGNENQLIEIFKEIKPHDYVFSSHRNHYHALLHGIKPSDLFAEIVGAKTSICKGNARSMGFISRQHNFFSSAIVGGCCAIAVGVAWALKEKKDSRRVWCFVGDGAVDGGHFWEALNYADGYKLPIKFVVENNERATCTSVKDRCGLAVGLREIIKEHPNVVWYNYKPTTLHVGSTKYVQF